MKLSQLKLRLQKLISEMRSLNESCVTDNEVRELTAEEKEKYTSLEGEVETVRSAISRLEKIQESEEVVADLEQERTAAPRVVITRENNCNEDGDYRGYASDSRGLGEFLQDVSLVKRSGQESKKLKEFRSLADSYNQTSGQDGGYLIQTDHVDMLFSNMPKDNIVDKCHNIEVSLKSNTASINQVDETSLERGSLYGGIVAKLLAEGEGIPLSKAKFRHAASKLHRIGAAAKVTEDQLEDASQLGSFLKEALPSVMLDELQYNILYGDGTKGFLGILNSGALITVGKESEQANNTIVGENINNSVDRLLSPNPAKTMWLAHPNAPKELRVAHLSLTNSDKPIYSEPGAFTADQRYLAGYPLAISQNCKNIGDIGDLILADFSGYALFRKTGIRHSVSAHVEFLSDQQVYKWVIRAAGIPLINNAIKDRHGDTTRSPFVTLAARK